MAIEFDMTDWTLHKKRIRFSTIQHRYAAIKSKSFLTIDSNNMTIESSAQWNITMFIEHNKIFLFISWDNF